MAVDPHTEALINADIDGELAEPEREELRALLRDDVEARQLHEELSRVCSQLDSLQPLEPPEHLKHAILDNLPRPKPAAAPEPSAWQALLSAPIFRHATAFAAGVIMTLALMSSNSISDNAFEDVTDLVGTIAEEQPNPGPGQRTINLTDTRLAGTVSIQRSGNLTVLDFNLTAAGVVEIVADLSDQDLWFRGFAQLENDNATVSADAGVVRMKMQGKNRYAMYLHNSGAAGTAVHLRFYADGDLVHEASFAIEGPGGRQ